MTRMGYEKYLMDGRIEVVVDHRNQIATSNHFINDESPMIVEQWHYESVMDSVILFDLEPLPIFLKDIPRI